MRSVCLHCHAMPGDKIARCWGRGPCAHGSRCPFQIVCGPSSTVLPVTLLLLRPSIFLLVHLHLLLLSEKLRYILTPRLIASAANAANSQADHSRCKRRRTATKIGYRELRHPLETAPPTPKTVTQLN